MEAHTLARINQHHLQVLFTDDISGTEGFTFVKTVRSQEGGHNLDDSSYKQNSGILRYNIVGMCLPSFDRLVNVAWGW